MILSKTVKVKFHASTIKHYKALGYIFEKHYDKQHARWQIKHGTTIDVKVEDLTKASHVLILVRCDCTTCTHGINNKPAENYISYKNYQRSIKTFEKYLCWDCAMQTPEFKEKIKKTSYLRTHKSGKDNANWNPNLTDKERKIRHAIPGICNWKNKVKKRDEFTCQKCGCVGHKHDNIMHAHHINSFDLFPELRLIVKNGITLCINCHLAANGMSLHNIYGKNPTLKEFCEFMKGSYLENNLKQQLINLLLLIKDKKYYEDALLKAL